MSDPLIALLAAAALGYPETREDHPWDHRAFKVREKMFLIIGGFAESPNVTMKLPAAHEFATALPGTAPSGYGLGRSGWVTIDLNAAGEVDEKLLLAWLDESYRAVAPKRLVKALPPR